jgi:cyclopropane-fatty-acyl-phospholipid synthase
MFIQGSGDKRADMLSEVLRGLDTACELEFPGGVVRRFGDQPLAFRVIFKNRRALRTPLTQYALARAYVENDIDLEGDMLALFDLRERLREPLSLPQTLRFASQLFLQSPRLVNSRSVSQHYSFGDDFYLTYIDQRFRFYSQCLFRSDDESLEDASEHKLESMWNALGLQPGMRLLDIGGGWGGVTEYCGSRGVHVTTLTLAPDSANYIRNLIKEKDLPGEVFLQDVLDHEPSIPYDHAVIYGVIEHVPNYRQFCTRAWSFLEPGGRLYLDAAATKEKYRMSTFNRRYIWTGTHCFMAVQDVVEELLFHGFEIMEVRRETHDYELTMWHWARRLEANREKIVELWGEEHYRAFRLFLWGGCHTFKTNLLQAYHLVAERRADPGPRPGNSRRLVNSLLALR